MVSVNDDPLGNRKYVKENLTQCTFYTTNPTWTTLGLNPDLRGEKAATNRLGYGTASFLL